MSGEQWRPVVGYEGLYEVSNRGAVRSLDRVTTDSLGRARPFPGKRLSASRSTKYPSVALCEASVNRTVRIHVLVAEAFLGPMPAGAALVRHLNDDPFDNRVENLAYGTKVDNGLDAVRNGRSPLAAAQECARGHSDFVVQRSGDKTQRMCRTCRNTRQAEYKRRRRAAARPAA